MVGGCGDILQGLGMPRGLASAMAQGTEEAQDSDGIPVSVPSLKAATDAQTRLASLKKVAIISYTQTTKTDWVSMKRFRYGGAVLRGAKSWEKALTAHGFEVVPVETVLANDVYKTFDWRASLAEELDSMGSLTESMLSAMVSVAQGDLVGLFLAVQDFYTQAATATSFAKAVAAAPSSLDSLFDRMDRIQKANAEETKSKDDDRASGGGKGRELVAKMETMTRSMGIDLSTQQLLYLPVSVRKDAVGATAKLQKAPSEWASAEPTDPFLANLAKSLGVDAMVLIRACVNFDPKAGTIGLCIDDQNEVFFYDANGGVLPIPMIDAPPTAGIQKAKDGIPSFALTSLPDDQKRALSSAKDTYEGLTHEAIARHIGGRTVSLLAWCPDDEEMSEVDTLAAHVVAALMKPIGR
ncbi:MAG: hypothetical protein ACHREM_17175 [Polyangiales bacterium]